MTRLLEFLRSSIGRKLVMALTGFVLFGFVVVHMLGNLQVYGGPGKLDEYGEALRKVPPLLWTARAVLLGCALAHIVAGVSLWLENRAARPVGYRVKKSLESTISSRTMVFSGAVVFLFVLFHILHLTTGTLHPDFRPGEVHRNFVTGFQVVGVSVFYMVATVCLCFHLWHGIWSFMQTLGLNHPRYNRLRVAFSMIVTILVAIGNLSFPLAVLTGVVK